MPVMERILRMIVYIRIFGEEPPDPIAGLAALDSYFHQLQQQCRRLHNQIGGVSGQEVSATAEAIVTLLTLPLAAEPIPRCLLPFFLGLDQPKSHELKQSSQSMGGYGD